MPQRHHASRGNVEEVRVLEALQCSVGPPPGLAVSSFSLTGIVKVCVSCCVCCDRESYITIHH